jgi:hypothetical protein
VVPLGVATIMMCLPTIYPVEIAGCALFTIAVALVAASVLRAQKLEPSAHGARASA